MVNFGKEQTENLTTKLRDRLLKFAFSVTVIFNSSFIFEGRTTFAALALSLFITPLPHSHTHIHTQTHSHIFARLRIQQNTDLQSSFEDRGDKYFFMFAPTNSGTKKLSTGLQVSPWGEWRICKCHANMKAI